MNLSFITIFLGLSLAYDPDELLAGFLKGKEKNCKCNCFINIIYSILWFFDFIFYGLSYMYVYVKSELKII